MFNIYFLISLLFIAAFVFNYFSSKTGTDSNIIKRINLNKITRISTVTILFIVSYLAGVLEILNYFDQQFIDTAVSVTKEYTYSVYNYDWQNFGTVWAVNYTLVYLIIVLFINDLKMKIKSFYSLNFILNLTSLRDSYLNNAANEYFESGAYNIILRYISLLPAAALLAFTYIKLNRVFEGKSIRTILDAFLHISIIWILSSELLNWMHIAGSGNSHKLGLSILWGIYSLFLIVLGIRQSNKYLRIGAIILFSATLLKLFFYDIAHLDTISKTIVFVSLGTLLLIISFLYNKYKNVIANE